MHQLDDEQSKREFYYYEKSMYGLLFKKAAK